MKPKPTLRAILAAIGASILAISSASAQSTLYWDGIPTTADAASDGGSGTWDTSTANWDNGISYQIWNNSNNDKAVFGGTSGTVTLGTDVTVGGLQFDTLSYVINSTAAETITLATGATLGSSVGGDNTTTPKIDSNFAGSNGFTKTGTGRLFLNATGSTLTGDINIAAGDLYARFEALGSGNIVFTGDSNLTKVYGASGSTTKTFTINDGVTATIGGSTFYYNFSTTGVLAGGNTAKLIMNMGGNTEKNFNNTANTFTGELTVANGGVGSTSNNNGGRARFRSLADSNGKLIIYNSTFILNNGGVSMNFANRQLEILGTGGNSRLMNESTDPAVTMTFARDVLVSLGNTSRSLILSGANTGNNTIAGSISNSANGTGVLSLAKWNAGTWVLGGANTYTGATTISSGTLTLGVDDCLADASNVVIGAGTLNVADSVNDTAGTLDVTNAASTINLGSGATLAFADSSAVDWTGGALDITGTFLEASSLRFGTTSAGLTPTQLALITLNGSPTSFSLDSSGYLVTGAPVDPYGSWSGGAAFGDDANGDGVSNGLAFLLGASGPNVSALDKLPTVTETSGGLVMNFSMLNAASRGSATLSVEHSSDLGIADDWTTVLVPDTAGISGPTSGVTFNVTPGSPLNSVTATISSSEAAFGKLFGRLKATE